MDGVWGTVNYLAPGSTRNRLYVAPGDQRATARYEARQVLIGDGRARRDDLALDAAGFALVDHRTCVPGLDSPAALDGAYTGECARLVRALTGADYVVSLGWLMRRTTADRRGALPPAPDVHVDLHTTEIAHRYARVHAGVDCPRPARTGGRSGRACGVRSPRRRRTGRSPSATTAPLTTPRTAPRTCCSASRSCPTSSRPDAPDEAAESAASLFFYNAAHRWWYFPGMHAGEALLIKLHDTDHSVAWRAPHTSFRDAADGAHPRESVECALSPTSR